MAGTINDSYGYNASNQLSSWTSGGTTTTYTTDRNGNLTAKAVGGSTTQSWDYNADDQTCWTFAGPATTTGGKGCETAPGGATTLSYDPAGNEYAASNGFAMSYNTANQATSLTHPGSPTVTMTYADATNDERVVADNGTTADKFVQGGLGVTHIKSVTGGVATHTYLTRDPSGRLIDIRSGSTTNYYLLDNLGSVRALFTASGTLSGTYTTDPFGNQTSGPSNDTNPFRYTGGYYDTEGDGFYHFGARYYTRDGRFTQQDPIATMGDRYLYASGNPVNLVDPDGRDLVGNLLEATGYVLGLAAIIATPAAPVALGIAALGGAAAGLGTALNTGSASAGVAAGLFAFDFAEAGIVVGGLPGLLLGGMGVSAGISMG